MKTVWKYLIPIDDLVKVALPAGAQLLHLDMQHDWLCLWALVDPDAPLAERVLRIAGTGHRIEDHHARHYLGTFFLHERSLVFHVFDVSEV